MNDAEILELLESDGDSAVALLRERYEGLVRLVVGKLISDGGDAEEAVSDTFIKLWKTRRNIDLSRSSLKTFICIVAKSCALNKLRGQISCEPLPDEENDLGFEIDYTAEAAKSINRRVVAECISAMPEPDRDVFILRYYYDLPVKAVAEKLGLTPRQSEYILSKDRDRLRQALIEGGIVL